MPETSIHDSLTLHNVQIDDLLTLGDDAPIDLDEHGSAPSTPPAGKVRLYAKSDGVLYQKDDAGTESALEPAAGGAVMKSAFDANSILAADVDDTPTVRGIGEDELVGRLAGGAIGGLSPSQAMRVMSQALVLPLQAQMWYDGTPITGCAPSGGAQTLSADRIYAIPFYCPWRTTWDAIGAYVDTADVGKKIKLGIYAATSAGLPGSRVFSSAELSLDATGELTETSIGLLLEPGLYFAAVRSDSGSAKLTGRSRSDLARTLGAADLSSNSASMFYSNTGSYAVDGLPATFPTSLSTVLVSTLFGIMLKTSATP